MRKRTTKRLTVAAVATAVSASILAGCDPVESWRTITDAVQHSPTSTPDVPAPAGLDGLAVSPAGTMAGYDRHQFGQRWSDDVDVAGGHNGCDTRNDVLRAQLSGVQLKPGTNACVVRSGTLYDPYTGTVIAFQRGQLLVDVDHVIPLADAWRHGAATWSADRRRNFANDPRNLIAVAAGPNRSKGDKPADEWLPPTGRCSYVRRQVAVKRAYGLTVTAAEHRTMASVLAACPKDGAR